ncbi:hypothetical protein J4O15_02525 [Lachnoanaerobaculum sp. Marseille-Q4761]|uniref:hypothetical protein n=1 Tax=Lachnoanaerobaculum sp. Marseille-Q4761 TaxID=2819511 RepID=UPI001AA0DF4F|nr:hypothetical protein [Lachnoanaerobaculum sp. Marseille-Q4761]MBO1869846.1 hypothetical protein [Lachnoanaerobaculum sp. Marseille-Q4761]
MNVIEKNKLKVILVITSILALVFIAIVGVEYLDKKREDRAIKYYEEIAITVTLADMLEMELECSDNTGKSWIITNQNESFTDIVSQDIADYISGKKRSLYNYKIIENENMQKYIDNFNDNMKNIRISGENGAGIPIPPKTISEGEGMEEFEEIKNLEELIAYMHKPTKNGEYYLYALSVIGLDGSSLNGRITFDMGDGTENVIHESGTIGIRELFTMPYRTYEYQRDVKVGVE